MTDDSGLLFHPVPTLCALSALAVRTRWHSFLQFDVTHSVVSWLSSSTIDMHWLFSVPLNVANFCPSCPLLCLTSLLVVRSLGTGPHWWFCGVCLCESGSLPSRCCTCSACWKETSNLNGRRSSSLLFQLFPLRQVLSHLVV